MHLWHEADKTLRVDLKGPDDIALGADLAVWEFGRDHELTKALGASATIAEAGNPDEVFALEGQEATILLGAFERVAENPHDAHQMQARVSLHGIPEHILEQRQTAAA